MHAADAATCPPSLSADGNCPKLRPLESGSDIQRPHMRFVLHTILSYGIQKSLGIYIIISAVRETCICTNQKTTAPNHARRTKSGASIRQCLPAAVLLRVCRSHLSRLSRHMRSARLGIASKRILALPRNVLGRMHPHPQIWAAEACPIPPPQQNPSFNARR